MLKILTFSTLYPNASQPYHGIFVEERVRRVVATGEASVHVIAPVPWFPFSNPRFGAYAKFASIPRQESRHGLVIDHPRFPVIPKIGMDIAARLMAAALMSKVKQLHDRHRFDIIDAHYYYPDGVAAATIARRLGLPLAITARGSDINVLTRFPAPRAQILAAIDYAAANITVSQALKNEILGLGVAADRVTVLRNGVDLERFRPLPTADRERDRAALGLTRHTIISVGGLIPLKGHDITILALRELPETELVIVGEGSEEGNLKKLAGELGVADRVHFAGRKSHDELVHLYNAADVSVLASRSEGMANVLLESLACGTPVIATAVGGNGEVIAAPDAGVLLEERSPGKLQEAYRALAARHLDRARVRRYAERFDWSATVRGQIQVFRDAIAAAPALQN